MCPCPWLSDFWVWPGVGAESSGQLKNDHVAVSSPALVHRRRAPETSVHMCISATLYFSVSSSCSLLLMLFPSGFLFFASNAYWSFSFQLQCHLPISWPSMLSIRVNRSLLSTPESYLMLHQRFACHVTVYKRFSQQWFHLVLRRTVYMNNNSRLLNIRRFIICLVLPTVSL